MIKKHNKLKQNINNKILFTASRNRSKPKPTQIIRLTRGPMGFGTYIVNESKLQSIGSFKKSMQ